MTVDQKPITSFINHHYRHFNAAALKDAAEGYKKHIEAGNKMMITLGGAMSTAELGLSLAEMIRQDKVHAICCTGANLEEDLYNLVAHDEYRRLPNYRDLTPEQEQELKDQRLNRVTDTCIPEEEAMKKLDRYLVPIWKEADRDGKRFFPHEFLFEMIRRGELAKEYQTDPKNSWMVAAAEKNLPMYVPGWEDSTLGNFWAALCVQEQLQHINGVKSGQEYMVHLSQWYLKAQEKASIGFFQIGGGISGDFPICVVPQLRIDLKTDVKLWSYFCQISDSTTSYGSYSGAVPNEKITWGKLGVDTPKHVIESDATIVAPLIFGYVLGW